MQLFTPAYVTDHGSFGTVHASGYPEKLRFWSMKLNVLQYVLLYSTACNWWKTNEKCIVVILMSTLCSKLEIMCSFLSWIVQNSFNLSLSSPRNRWLQNLEMLVSFQSGDRHKTSHRWWSEMDNMDLFLQCANGTWEDPFNCLQRSKLLPVHNARACMVAGNFFLIELLMCSLSRCKYVDV